MPSTHAPSPAQPRWLPPSPEPTRVSTGTHSRALEAGRSSSREPQGSQSHSAASAEKDEKGGVSPGPRPPPPNSPVPVTLWDARRDSELDGQDHQTPDLSSQPRPPTPHPPPPPSPEEAPVCSSLHPHPSLGAESARYQPGQPDQFRLGNLRGRLLG